MKAPAPGDEDVSEHQRQRTGRVSHVDAGTGGERRVERTERLLRELGESLLPIPGEREPPRGLSLVVDAVGGIGEAELGPLPFEQPGVGACLARVAAEQAMAAEGVEVAGLRASLVRQGRRVVSESSISGSPSSVEQDV